MSSKNFESPSDAPLVPLHTLSSRSAHINADDMTPTDSFSTRTTDRPGADNEQSSQTRDMESDNTPERGLLLLELPAELRNTIYELALTTDDGSSITIPSSGHLPRPALLKKERESITALELECVCSAELGRIIDCYARAVVGGPAIAPPLPADEYKRRMAFEAHNIHKEHLPGLMMLGAMGIPLAALKFLGPAPDASDPTRTVEATRPWLECNVLALLRSRLEDDFEEFFEAVGEHVEPLLKAVGTSPRYAELNESSKAEMCFRFPWRALDMAD